MKRIITKFFAVTAVMLLSVFAARSHGRIEKQTLQYAQKGGQTLRLDRYYIAEGEEKPCVLFMFGGAFARGTRDREDYIAYFNYLVRRGYNVVSIDYRLGLKDIEQVPNLTDELAARMLVNSVNMAKEDLYDATRFILDHAREWNIAPGRIILNGSSAGAVTVLQAEYEMTNGLTSEVLPAGFRYAGVMAFAGAILNLAGDLVWNGEPAPMLLMHGDADRQVPYNELRHGDMGFFGSDYISRQLTAQGCVHTFYSFENFGHEIASVPIREYWDEINSFLIHVMEKGERTIIKQTVRNLDMPEIVKKDFTIQDFLNGNYGL